MNKKQKEAIKNAINKCRYPVNEEIHSILVPQNHEIDCMFASYLIKEFGFRIQFVVPGSVEVKELFNPKMNIIKPPEANTDQDFLKEGQFYKLDTFGCISHIKLIKIHKNQNCTWQYSDGRTFENRKIDIDLWIRREQISLSNN